jgi:hypothetical protein
MDNSKRISLRTVMDKDKMSVKDMKMTIGGLATGGACPDATSCVNEGYVWDYINNVCDDGGAGCGVEPCNTSKVEACEGKQDWQSCHYIYNCVTYYGVCRAQYAYPYTPFCYC